jgi:hypothetical protein
MVVGTILELVSAELYFDIPLSSSRQTYEEELLF